MTLPGYDKYLAQEAAFKVAIARGHQLNGYRIVATGAAFVVSLPFVWSHSWHVFVCLIAACWGLWLALGAWIYHGHTKPELERLRAMGPRT